MSKKYRSEAMAAIHETMAALHDAGAIDKQTMRRFDPSVLVLRRSGPWNQERSRRSGSGNMSAKQFSPLTLT
jgi:putative transcriptional regulator